VGLWILFTVDKFGRCPDIELEVKGVVFEPFGHLEGSVSMNSTSKESDDALGAGA